MRWFWCLTPELVTGSGVFVSGLKQVGKAALIAENKHLVGHELEVELANLRHSAVRLGGIGYIA